MRAIFRLRSSTLAVALGVAAVLGGLLVAAASAHHGEPATGEDEVGTLGAQNTAGTLSTDTELTPVGKDGATAGWQQIAGSLWRPDGTITEMARPSPGLDSPTPYDLDFYGLGFLKVEIAQNAGLSAAAASNEAKANGFAVGAQCRRSDPAQPVPAEAVPGCERVPVIYRYQDHPTKGLVWEQSYPDPDDKATDPGGFVAAVAWLTPNRALAVGGTGTYPRREVERVPGEPDNAEGDAAYARRDACQGLAPGEPCRGAGMARAWIFERDPESADPKLRQGTWRELKNKPDPAGGFTGEDGDEIPDEMRALHAIDASPRPADCLATLAGTLPQAECAIAGGMRQLWHFADGRFVRGYGPELGTPPGEGIAQGGPPADFSSPANFRFRVRDVRFYPNWQRVGRDDIEPLPSAPTTLARAVTSGCCSGDRSADRPALLSLRASGWRAIGGGSLSAETVLGDKGSFNPDSYYALSVLHTSQQLVSALRTPGGPSERYGLREPPSRFTEDSFNTTQPRCDTESCAITNTPSGAGSRPAAGTTLSSLRLVSADGDSRGFTAFSAEAGQAPDAIPDWGVGVLRSTGRGVAYHVAFGGNRAGAGFLANPKQCRDDEALLPSEEAGGLCNFEAYQRHNASKALYALPSYALNAYRVAGEDPPSGEEGVGWAVGDHGAIATRGGGIATAEAPPARQGARSSPQPLPREAFDRHRPETTDEPGPVPGLAPGAVAVEPGFYEGQSPSFPNTIPAKLLVMSRDGSEGWAFGSWPGGSAAYRYDGRRWTRCDPEGIAGLIPPDPACTEAPPADRLQAVARVPLERDSDPTNDEEFEAVAVTTSPDSFYRYREGRWSHEPEAPGGDAVAFTAPDDGWVVGPVNASQAGESTEIDVRHFNGESWVQCTRIDEASAPEECSDDAGRLRVRGLCRGGSARLAVAGERVYLYTTRDLGPRAPAGGAAQPCLGAQPELYPVILYRDRGGEWTGGIDETPTDGAYNPTDGGWDPGCVDRLADPPPGTPECVATDEPGDESHQGRVDSLSVAQDADGSLQGWAIGAFGGVDKSARALIIRLSDGHDVLGADDRGVVAWRPWTVRDAADDYLRFPATGIAPAQQLTLPAETGQRNAFMFLSGRISTFIHESGFVRGRAPALAYDRERRRWTAIATPWQVSNDSGDDTDVNAIAPDGRGGFWASGTQIGFHHYTDRAPREVFSEVPDPTAGRARLTALGAGADGTVWLGDSNGSVYRYDRLAGWSGRVEIPGWEAARATRRARVSAIAVGPDGEGVAVGPGGRIANLGERVGLDPAAAAGCDPQAPVPPCGTGKDLLAAAVAPDGSAIVAGQNRALLWRPAGGDFRPPAGTPPRVPAATPIVDVEMPTPDRAYLLTQAGFANRPAARVIRGDMSAPGVWEWRIELGDSQGTPDPLTASRGGFPPHAAIADLAVDASGHGYAVGARGLVLERTGEGIWRRVPNPDETDLTTLALPASGGEGALLGGWHILTLVGDRFEVARHLARPDSAGAFGLVRELALTPGYEPGSAEAWALKGSVLLHHPGDSADPRLDPARGLAPLADAPATVPREVAFAAFGKTDCGVPPQADALGRDTSCKPLDGSNQVTANLVSSRIREELAARSGAEGVPQFTLFTGDAVDEPGGRETVSVTAFIASNDTRTPLDTNLKHRRWVELVANSLLDEALPTFGALGGQDLARKPEWCARSAHLSSPFGVCPQRDRRLSEVTDRLGAGPGVSLPWRATMASMPAPWEREQQAGGLRFERVGAGALAQRGPDASTPDAEAATSTGGQSVRIEGYPLDSGDTHYAVDVIEEATDEKLARIVVADTSMGSIAASDPGQHPIEAGGQLRWLEEVLCFEGSAEDTDGDIRDCTREEGQQAIVLSNTPTYSYGPISPDETQADAAAFEAVLLKNQVNVVVSGRLGWQGRYWTLAPGVHAPCPGQAYRSDSQAPSLANVEVCGADAASGVETPDPGELIEGLPEDAKRAAGLAGRAAIPFVVSSTAGGRFNARAERGGFATAESGFWRGYSIVRLHPSGDPAKTIVEQRPILDWVGLSASDPAVAPGQRLQLQSYAREAFGMDTAPRYYEIPETQAITHRWHLLLANPKEPWRACEADDSSCVAVHAKLSARGSGLASQHDGAAGSTTAAMQDLTPSEGAENPCAPYLCLPENIGTIDPDTGEVRAGNGKYPDTFALATLSVGEHVAVQPLVFTKSASFVLSALGLPPEVPAPGANVANAPTAPPPPSAPKPPIPQVNTPEPPLPPSVPPIAATQPPEPQPPAPPAPPPPTDQPSPLNLTLAPPGIAIATPTAVIQPPTPPVNPAPPGGARREARQRQAAAQKSGADADEQAIDNAGDLAEAPLPPHGSAMTRRDRIKPGPSFTAIARPDQPSAWAQGALYSGGLTLVAAALALGWSGVRPTPRRRPPEVPSPAWARAPYRHR